MAFLYKITNIITNKSYIGWTGKTVEGRWATHKTDALKNKDNRKFYNSIRKYGIDCWTVNLSNDMVKKWLKKEWNLQ